MAAAAECTVQDRQREALVAPLLEDSYDLVEEDGGVIVRCESVILGSDGLRYLQNFLTYCWIAGVNFGR